MNNQNFIFTTHEEIINNIKNNKFNFIKNKNNRSELWNHFKIIELLEKK